MIKRLFPFLDWFKDYNSGTFRIDLLAGITVALVLIPQSMAYAQLAGLPAYYGLYAAFLPPIVAALFGSSRQLATGPVAVVSLMSAASLEPLATAGSEEFIAYSIILALTVGIFQFSLGVLRLGLVVNLLSHPVVNGFTNAAAIIIASSQFSKFFGVYVDKAPHHYETLVRVVQAAGYHTHMPTLLFGCGAIFIMVVLRKINPRIPNVLIAVAITTLISYLTGFHRDVFVDVEAIEIPEFRQQVNEFNTTIKDITRIGTERAALVSAMETEKQQLKRSHLHQSEELIALQARIEVLNLHLEQTKEHSSYLRHQLRRIKLTATENNGSYRFFGESNVPAGTETTGSLWFVRVGNRELDEANLKISGGGAVVGQIPDGLPRLSLPHLDIAIFLKLLPTAVIISLLGFMEAIAIAKAMANYTGQKLDPNQELIGQGLANIIGSVGSSYAVSGSFSRSAVNLQAGAVTGISSVITSIMVCITLLFLTPLLYYLPQAVLAAVIMMAVIGLLNVKGFIHAWKAQWYDGVISVVSFVVTLYFAPHLDKGIIIGVFLTMVVFLYKSMRPVVSRLSMSEEEVFKETQSHQIIGCSNILVIRFDGPLFFANATYLEEQVFKFRTEQSEISYVLLDARGINDMDMSGEEALATLVRRIHGADLGFAMCGVKKQVLKVMTKTGLLDEIGEDSIYPDSLTATRAILKTIYKDKEPDKTSCTTCPLSRCILLDS